MNHHDDRTSWEDQIPDLRSLMDQGRAYGPTPLELDRLAARLAPTLGAPPASPGPGLFSKVLGATKVLGVAGALALGAGLAALSATSTPEPSVLRRTTLAARLASAPGETRLSTDGLAPPPSTDDAAPAVPAQVGHARPSSAPARARAPRVATPTALSAAPAAASADMPAAADPDVDEVAMLVAARSALGTSPARALELLDQHARRFPKGALGQEREVIVIEALAALGRTGEARLRGQRFVATFPRSVHRHRIEAIAGSSPDSNDRSPSN